VTVTYEACDALAAFRGISSPAIQLLSHRTLERIQHNRGRLLLRHVGSHPLFVGVLLK
jgi:hypothetical protein